MPNANQILFIIIVTCIFLISLIVIYYVMNKANAAAKRRFDLEEEVQQQEHIYYLAAAAAAAAAATTTMTSNQQYPPPVTIQQLGGIMTPTKDKIQSKRESILNKLYGFRTTTSPPLPPQRPSSIRPPSFLPMQEKYKVIGPSPPPPAYEDLLFKEVKLDEEVKNEKQ